MCAQIVFCVERSGKFFGFDGFTAAGGVNKFAVADVEADMGIFVCAAVFIDELDHAAAVKACGCGAAAPFVGCADQTHAVKHQFLRTLCAVDMGNADRLDFSGGCLRLVGFVFASCAAGGQQ